MEYILAAMLTFGTPQVGLADWWAGLFNKNYKSFDVDKPLGEPEPIVVPEPEPELSRCERKALKYKEKLKEDPESDYLNWRYETWLERCEQEELGEPRIQEQIQQQYEMRR